jgi:AAA domain
MNDPNDTLIEGGPGAVRSEFDNIVAMARRPKGFVFHGDEAAAAPPMLVKGILPVSGIAFIGGQSGAGKTFIAVDLAVALASGSSLFFGHKICERVGVVLIAAEGRGMLASRIEAACRHRGIAEKHLPIAWTAEVPELKKPDLIKKFVAGLGVAGQQFRKDHDVRLGVVIIDTVVATFNLDDEDNNSEAARAIRTMREMGNACGALIMPVHHYGKSVTTGLRGGSSWRGGADVIVSVLADRDDTTGDVKNRRVAVAKARDGEEGPIAGFALKWMNLGLDVEGAPFGACFVEPALGSGVGTRAAEAVRSKRMDRSEQVFRDAFTEVCDSRGADFSVRGDGPTVRAVRVQDLRAEFDHRYATGEGDPVKLAEASRRAFRRVLERLARQFSTETRGAVEWIWSAPR